MTTNTLMLNGNLLMTGDPTLKLDRPWFFHPYIQISALSIANPVQLKWVYLTLPLCKGNTIKEIVIYYNTINARSFISQTRLDSETSTTVANVVFSDAAPRTSVPPTSYSVSPNLTVNGSIVLMLALSFANTTDLIQIGAIEIICQ